MHNTRFHNRLGFARHFGPLGYDFVDFGDTGISTSPVNLLGALQPLSVTITARKV
jgi:hypothetical protein